jgi:3'(2'), 5'-bisphosphate nucleotidase
MKAELEAAKQLALEAGGILLTHYSLPASVRWKAQNNPVTTADQAASEFLMGRLRQLFPGDGILCEEEMDDPARATKSRVWIIDPMDGTKEFISRTSEFAVMIGLAVEGVPSIGVVYQPTNGKLYHAARGLGASLEEGTTIRPLRVSAEATASQMTIAVSRSHHSSRVEAVRVRLGIPASIPSGSLGLKVGLISEGRAHVYLHTGRHTYQWDTCAPEAILREAGGRMTNIFGAPLRYNQPEVENLHGVVASNGAIHDRILEVAQAVVAGA